MPRTPLILILALASCQSAQSTPDQSPERVTAVPSVPDEVESWTDDVGSEEDFVEIEIEIEIPEDAERESADRNGDGTEEVLASWYEGGSGFGGTTCVLDDPAGGRQWTASSYSYFGSAVSGAMEPVGLRDDGLLTALMDCATGPLKGANAGVRWWLDAYEAQSTDTSSGAISARWNVETTWQSRASMEEPGAVIHVPVDQVRPWMKGVFETDEPDFGDTGLRLMYSGTYGKFEKTAQLGGMTLFTAPHSVAIKGQKSHALMFISDGRWGGTDKRRHRSIVASGFVNSGEVWALQTSGTAPHTVWLLSMKEQIGVSLGELNWTGEVDWEALPEAFVVKRSSSGFRFEAGGVSATLALP